MKRYAFINIYSCLLASGLSLISCGSDVGEGDAAATKTPLQVELAGADATRSSTISALPDGSTYGVFAAYKEEAMTLTNGSNAIVNYKDGVSTMASTVYLPSDSIRVFAYYPYSKTQTLTALTLETASQTDYLIGQSVDAAGNGTCVNAGSPKAKIKFTHAMALLTFKITQDASNTDVNKITQIRVSDVPSKSTYNFVTGTSKVQTVTDVTIGCSVTASTTTQSVDMLALPLSDWSYVTLYFYMNGNWVTSATKAYWQAGKQYTYNVTVGSDKLIVSEPTITPRTNNVQGEMNVSGQVNK